MSFAYARTDGGIPVVIGNKKMTYGTYTNAGGDTGGNIDTGLTVCEAMFLQTGAAVSADQATINETLPADGSVLTIVTTDGSDGSWIAIGY